MIVPRQCRHRVADEIHHAGFADVVGAVDLRRHVASDDQGGVIGLVQHDPIGTHMEQELVGEILAHHVVGRRLEGEARQMSL